MVQQVTAASPSLTLAAKVGVHVVQFRRYEAGSSQPTLTSSAASPSLSR